MISLWRYLASKTIMQAPPLSHEDTSKKKEARKAWTEFAGMWQPCCTWRYPRALTHAWDGHPPHAFAHAIRLEIRYALSRSHTCLCPRMCGVQLPSQRPTTYPFPKRIPPCAPTSGRLPFTNLHLTRLRTIRRPCFRVSGGTISGKHCVYTTWLANQNLRCTQQSIEL